MKPKLKTMAMRREREGRELGNTAKPIGRVCVCVRALTQKGVTTFCLLVVKCICMIVGWHNVQVQYQVITSDTSLCYAMRCLARQNVFALMHGMSKCACTFLWLATLNCVYGCDSAVAANACASASLCLSQFLFNSFPIQHYGHLSCDSNEHKITWYWYYASHSRSLTCNSISNFARTGKCDLYGCLHFQVFDV